MHSCIYARVSATSRLSDTKNFVVLFNSFDKIRPMDFVNDPMKKLNVVLWIFAKARAFNLEGNHWNNWSGFIAAPSITVFITIILNIINTLSIECVAPSYETEK